VQLAEQIRAAWAGTIAGELADNVRKEVLRALERSLIDICCVPRGGIASMSHGLSETLAHIVLSKVRDEIGTQGFEVLDEIIKTPETEGSSESLRQLMSVWYYFFPQDDKVRRGDLIEVGDELGFVVTPACDLVKFPKKTGRQVTWLRCVRLDSEGLGGLRVAGYEIKKDIGNSIIASHGGAGDAIIMLPNVPEASERRDTVVDYVLLCHAWESRTFKSAPSGVARYRDLPELRRRCTLADPFASAVVSKVTAVISSPGMPDLPKGEISRLRGIVSG
jgi:hypothetical protein